MKEIVERLHEKRQIELAKRILSDKREYDDHQIALAEGILRESSQIFATLEDRAHLGEGSIRDLLDEFLGTSDDSKIYVVEKEDASYRKFLNLLRQGKIDNIQRVSSAYTGEYQGKKLVMTSYVTADIWTFYFTDSSILDGLKYDKDDTMAGTIYDKVNFDKKMILELYKKGKSMIEAGKSIDDAKRECIDQIKRVVEEHSPQEEEYLKLRDEYQELVRATKERMKEEGIEPSDGDLGIYSIDDVYNYSEELRDLYDKLESLRPKQYVSDMIAATYKDLMVPILVASEQLKFVRVNAGVKYKPFDQSYYLNTLLKEAGLKEYTGTWYHYY